MKRLVGILIIIVCTILVVGAEEGFKRNNLSIKAGPTEPGEALSMVWVESFVYPKDIEADETLTLGVRTAAKVKSVRATFDFNRKLQILTSTDGLNWNGVFQLPSDLAAGVHVVRYQIVGNRGSLQRTIEFYVKAEEARDQLAETTRTTEPPSAGWSLTVTSSCSAFSNGATRLLHTGQILLGLAKVPWYRVMFDDGKEGWVPAAQVKEPTEDYYFLGYKAYQNKDYLAAIKYYRSAVEINPEFAKAYTWLSKSYAAHGDLSEASQAIQKALKLDDRNIDNRVVANNLSYKIYQSASEKFRARKYSEAIGDYKEALSLKPNSTVSWLELGECYKKLGLHGEARAAWKEALKYDPENSQVRALVKPLVTEPVAQTTQTTTTAKGPLPDMLLSDSLKIVRDEKTSKGTKMEKAIRSVVAMTRSLGTTVVEKGWQVKKQGEKYLASYQCEQSGGGLETFDWLVDIDTKQIVANNENARILMNRW